MNFFYSLKPQSDFFGHNFCHLQEMFHLLASDCKRRTGGKTGIGMWFVSASSTAKMFLQLEKGAVGYAVHIITNLLLV